MYGSCVCILCVYIYIYAYVYTHIHVYIVIEGTTANLRTKILDLRWFDSNIMLILRGGALISIGHFPQNLNQQILVGTILVGGLGVRGSPGMGVVSDSWFDRVSLSIIYMFRPSC